MIAGKAFLPHEWGSYAWRSPGECQPTELWCLHCKNYIPVSKMWEKCVSREVAERDANLDRIEKTYFKTACSVCGEVFTGLVHDCPQRKAPERMRGMIGGIAEGLYSVSHTERCKTVCRLVSEIFAEVDRRIEKAFDDHRFQKTHFSEEAVKDIADERIGKARVEYKYSGSWEAENFYRIVPGK